MVLRTFITGIILTTGAFAQMSSFPKPSYFREILRQTKTRVDLRDPARLKDFVVDGKLELSLKNYLELVMANNTDVQVTFLSLEIPKNNITAAFGVWDPTANASFSSSLAATSVPDQLRRKTQITHPWVRLRRAYPNRFRSPTHPGSRYRHENYTRVFWRHQKLLQ